MPTIIRFQHFPVIFLQSLNISVNFFSSQFFHVYISPFLYVTPHSYMLCPNLTMPTVSTDVFPCLSLSFPVFPCLSLSFQVYPCLYWSVFACLSNSISVSILQKWRTEKVVLSWSRKNLNILPCPKNERKSTDGIWWTVFARNVITFYSFFGKELRLNILHVMSVFVILYLHICKFLSIRAIYASFFIPVIKWLSMSVKSFVELSISLCVFLSL